MAIKSCSLCSRLKLYLFKTLLILTYGKFHKKNHTTFFDVSISHDQHTSILQKSVETFSVKRKQQTRLFTLLSKLNTPQLLQTLQPMWFF